MANFGLVKVLPSDNDSKFSLMERKKAFMSYLDIMLNSNNSWSFGDNFDF